jgi:hypothetical protein
MQNIATLHGDIIGAAIEKTQAEIKKFIGEVHPAAKVAWTVVGIFILSAVFWTGYHNWNLFARGSETEWGKTVAIIPALLLDGSLVLLLVLLLTYFKDETQWRVAVLFNVLLFLIIGINTSIDYSMALNEPLGENLRTYLHWGVAWSFLATLAMWEVIIHLDPIYKQRMEKMKLELQAQRAANAAELTRFQLSLKRSTDELEYQSTLQERMHGARMNAVQGEYVENALIDYEKSEALAEAQRIRAYSPKA